MTYRRRTFGLRINRVNCIFNNENNMSYLRGYFAFLCLLLEVKRGMFESATVSSCATSGQHFDGASFVGGIVLAVGLVAIGYVIYRYFQNKRQAGMTFNDI